MRVISLGLGVQSTAMYLLSSFGGFERADLAVFSDLGAERPETYENLNKLQEMDGIPIKVTKNNLYADILNQKNSTGQRLASIPAFAESGGMLRRQCTREYKIQPIQRVIREAHGLKPRQRMKPTELWLGISMDEADRMKPSYDYNIKNRFPLIELSLNRSRCGDIVKKYGLNAVKSSCVFCPYQSDRQWKLTKLDSDSWSKAIAVDEAIRDMSKRGLRDRMFLHRSCKPLRDVDFDAQADLFSEECEGYCFL